MKDIQCRAKTINNSKWIEGGYFRHQNRTSCFIGNDSLTEKDYTSYIFTSGFSDWNLPKPIETHEVFQETVCEYTGYEPKCGKIFDKDILGFVIYDGVTEEYVYEEGLVSLIEGAWKVIIINGNEDKEWRWIPSLHHVLTLDKVKIVGNAIDNPDRTHLPYWDTHSITINDDYWITKD